MGSVLRWLLLATVSCFAPPSWSGLIDLHDFFADPAVTISPAGDTATLAEDASLNSVILSDDPGLGDPVVVVPGPGVVLRFDFVFREAPGESDELLAFVLDAATGGSLGGAYEFRLRDSGSDTQAFDLSALTGKTLGLQFQLSSLPGDNGLGSWARISRVRLSQVPEPSGLALGLLGLGLLGRIGVRRVARGR